MLLYRMEIVYDTLMKDVKAPYMNAVISYYGDFFTCVNIVFPLLTTI